VHEDDAPRSAGVDGTLLLHRCRYDKTGDVDHALGASLMAGPAVLDPQRSSGFFTAMRLAALARLSPICSANHLTSVAITPPRSELRRTVYPHTAPRN
jgi:hypothetical protein